MRRLSPTTLMPEKLRGQLKWRQDQQVLHLQHGAIVVAAWDPYVRNNPRGLISIYGEPRGKVVFYKTWKGWKDKLWKLYRVRPPATYHI